MFQFMQKSSHWHSVKLFREVQIDYIDWIAFVYRQGPVVYTVKQVSECQSTRGQNHAADGV